MPMGVVIWRRFGLVLQSDQRGGDCKLLNYWINYLWHGIRIILRTKRPFWHGCSSPVQPGYENTFKLNR